MRVDDEEEKKYTPVLQSKAKSPVRRPLYPGIGASAVVSPTRKATASSVLSPTRKSSQNRTGFNRSSMQGQGAAAASPSKNNNSPVKMMARNGNNVSK